MDRHDIQKIRDSLVEAALPHVPFDGWRMEMIESAARETGQGAGVVRAVFADGMGAVLDHFADWADRQMLAALADVDPEDLRVRDRVKEALMARYRVLAPHKEAVRLSAQYWVNPLRKPQGAKLVWRTADVIWDWAGDSARDYNRYTKRGLLSGVIVSTTYAWLNDTSEDLDRTARFLDRRIENVMQLGKVISRFKPRTSSRPQTKAS